jgi:hypothetical protein
VKGEMVQRSDAVKIVKEVGRTWGVTGLSRMGKFYSGLD